ncbi:MAG: FAD-dependent oxidoreductase [Eggerthellaceae bacterium]|nr:FAD-dependent oxidoreductase [Eggerthellaceae bacterium]
MDTQANVYDAVIVGAGPAGLTAALYLARARMRVIVVEKDKFGGQITITEEVVNYPGIERTSGKALTDTMRKQAEAFGAEMKLAEVTSIEEGEVKIVHTSAGDIEAHAVLLAIGSQPRSIGFPGEAEFKGHGVAYCATCDGEFFTGKRVYVVGGGFAAAEESVFLTKYASDVHILIRGDDFSCAPAAADPARANDKISIHTNTEIAELSGDAMPRKIVTKNNKTGETETFEAPEGDTFGVFVLAGYAPDTAPFKDLVELDERGNIVTHDTTHTSAEGIFAAGDVTVKNLRQVVTATGEAAIAATEMEHYIAQRQKATGIVPQAPATRMGTPTQEANAAPAATASAPASAGTFFDADAAAQIAAVFERMERPMVLDLALDDRPVSAELEAYATELAGLGDKLTVSKSQAESEDHLPRVAICAPDGKPTGLAFHGVPGGHEGNSFIRGFYNAAGPGQPLDDATRTAIEAIDKPIKLQILVSLTCTMCPDLVVAAQRIAALNPQVTAEVYDIAHFPDLREAYNVMSVPCLVINDGETVSFGKKGIPELLELIA